MFRYNVFNRAMRYSQVALCLLVIWHAAAFAVTAQQTGDDVATLREQVKQFVEQKKYIEALPLLERLAQKDPDDPETHLLLGFALIAKANTITDAAARKALRVWARAALLKAKSLGMDVPLVNGLLQNLPDDGSDGGKFSSNPEADKLMEEAESLFSQGNFDAALQNYQKALTLDPKLYEAALFSGDVYLNRDDYAQAETWYQKAITINPNRETAYRYSATPLMKQGKTEAARDRYIEAYIAEPYSNLAISGITQWAKATRTPLGHPKIDIPTDVTFDDKGNANINLDSGTLLGGANDGSFAWIAYGATRTDWRKQKFAKTFPNEKTYRHSLAEEADALRSVLKIATANKKVKTLSPTLAKLKKLDDEGLLEAYLLLAKADDGIAADHQAYLQQNRDKLRRYVLTYVVTGGGA